MNNARAQVGGRALSEPDLQAGRRAQNGALLTQAPSKPAMLYSVQSDSPAQARFINRASAASARHVPIFLEHCHWEGTRARFAKALERSQSLHLKGKSAQEVPLVPLVRTG